MKKIRLIELFSGIGAVHKAFTNLGIDVEVVDAIEIDKVAMTSYNVIHNESFQVQDIRDYKKTKQDVGEIDLIWNSSPCTDFSTMGLNRSGTEGSGTKSSLVYEAIRIVDEIRPKVVIWENVKGLVGSRHIHILEDYIRIMENFGYKSYYKVLNALDFGIPQNRERVFVVSMLDHEKDFKFPNPTERVLLKDFLDEYSPDAPKADTITISSKIKESVKVNMEREKELIATTTKPIWQCVCKNSWSDNRIGILNTSTIRALNNYCVVLHNNVVRKITALESYLLTGFTKEDYDKVVSAEVAMTNIYKQAGNSVVVDVIEGILAELYREDLHQDYAKAIHPGLSVREALEIRNITQVEFSRRTGISRRTISRAVNQGKYSMRTAISLEIVTGIPLSFWLNLKNNYINNLNK